MNLVGTRRLIQPTSHPRVCAFTCSTFAVRASALAHYSPAAVKSPLESIEDIEILRIVEAGLHVQMVEVLASGIAVDTPEDFERAAHLVVMTADDPTV